MKYFLIFGLNMALLNACGNSPQAQNLRAPAIESERATKICVDDYVNAESLTKLLNSNDESLSKHDFDPNQIQIYSMAGLISGLTKSIGLKKTEEIVNSGLALLIMSKHKNKISFSEEKTCVEGKLK